MKKYMLAAMLLAGTLGVTAQTKSDKEPYATNRFADAKVSNLIVETTGGNITVSGTHSPGAIVEVYINQNNRRGKALLSKEETKQKLDEEYDMNISYANNKITAIAKRKQNDKDWNRENSLSVSFKVSVPENTATELRTSGGNITLSTLTGIQHFSTSGGNLKLDNLGGQITGKTSGGNITIKNLKDEIDLSTSGGNIDAENTSGKIKLRTSGGNLTLSGLNGDIAASTSGGNIHGDHISGDLNTHTSGGSIKLMDISAGLDATTSGGNIDVSLTDITKNINLSNSSGTIYLQLPKNKGMDLRLSANNIRTEPLPNFKGTQEKERIDGTVNGGGVSVRVNAGSGNIHLTLK
jgi:hypothetical protein